MRWLYLDLVALPYSNEFKLVDEDGEPFTEDGSLVYFTSFAEAEAYLVEHDIRGTVR